MSGEEQSRRSWGWGGRLGQLPVESGLLTGATSHRFHAYKLSLSVKPGSSVSETRHQWRALWTTADSQCD